MKKKNRGFTLVEMVVIISIFVLLLGIMVPSLNSILGFRVQRAANSIASALDKTKIEASNRLVGEMMLERREDGYYISYIIDRGKVNGKENIKWNEDEEKIAPSKTSISYKVEGGNEAKEMTVGESLIITYDRATGAFCLCRVRMRHIGIKIFFRNCEMVKVSLLVESIVIRLLSVVEEERE